ncbi:MerR family regulatory protein [Calothrix sp. NIES-4071]|nr:MerR family regulatory protein [Calothrix sp. NIES-4071]BAZ64072.1 MerR family regulatory protein [Calothrix sp. NIES-4105]
MEQATLPDVLTLEETAQYLRLPVELVLNQARIGNIPGRKIGEEWRFSKSAINNWLNFQSSRSLLLSRAGAFEDDDSLADLTAKIYEARGRSEVDETPGN